MLDIWLAAKALGYGAEGTGEPGGADAWNNMAPPVQSFKADQDAARGLYADAFGNAVAYSPNAKAAQVAPTTLGRDDLAARKVQQDYASLLSTIAAGGPGGVADPAARANLASAAAANQAYAVSRGQANPAATMRTLGNTNAAMNAGAEARIAAMRAQEQKAADAAAISNLASMRAGDSAAATEAARLKAAAEMANAGFKTQTSLANDDAMLKAQGVRRAALGAQSGHDRQMWENQMAKEKWKRGESIYDDAFNWRKQSRDLAAMGQTMDTTGKLVTLGANAGSK